MPIDIFADAQMLTKAGHDSSPRTGWAMVARLSICAVAVGMLAACQSTEARKQQLAQICADPLNRQVGTFYFAECESLYPLTDAQKATLIKIYGPSGPPAGS